MKIGQFCENPIFLGSFALFSTMTPFFDTFFGSLGVEKRATIGVEHQNMARRKMTSDLILEEYVI